MKFRVAVCQMLVNERDKAENLKKALKLLEDASEDGARIACLPDYFLTDNPTTDDTMEDIRKLAEPIPGPSTERIMMKAKELKMYVVAGGLIEKGGDGKLYSTSPLIGPNGKLIAKVRKTHPEDAPAKNELSHGITPAPPDYPVIETEIARIGIMIDMDGFANEFPRILGLKGAELIFWPSNFSVRFTSAVHLATREASNLAGCTVAGAARVGWRMQSPMHDWAFMGKTRADMMYGGGSEISQGGIVMTQVPDFTEGIAVTTVTIDREKNKASRKASRTIMPLLRRPDTYGKIIEKEEPW